MTGLGRLAGFAADARAFAPYIDAAIVVPGADPLISGDELALVQAVLERRLKLPIGDIHEVSGLQPLGGRRIALTHPRERPEQRTVALTDAARRAGRWTGNVGAVRAREQRRLVAELDTLRVAFVPTAQPGGRRLLPARLAAICKGWSPQPRREAIARFLKRECLARVSQLGISEFAGLEIAADEDATLDGQAPFCLQAIVQVARSASAPRLAADAELAGAGAGKVIRADACRLLAWLLEMNSARRQADVGRRSDESRMRVEREVRDLLLRVRIGAIRTVAYVLEMRPLGASRVVAEVARLDPVDSNLRAVTPLAEADPTTRGEL